MVASEITANVFPIPIKTSYQHLCDSSDVHRAGARIFLCPKNDFLGQSEAWVTNGRVFGMPEVVDIHP